MANLTTTQGQQDTGNNQALAANAGSGSSATTTTPSSASNTALVNTVPPQNTQSGTTQPATTGTDMPSAGNAQQTPPSTAPTPADITTNTNTNQPSTTSSLATSGSDTNLPTNTQQAPQQAKSTHTGAIVQNTMIDEATTGGAVLMITGELVAAFVVITLCYYLYSRWLDWYEKYKKDHPQPVPVPCKTCGGTGVVKEKITKSAPCKHCRETGRDICHHCGGSGKNGLGLTIPQTEDDVASLMNCDYCEGTGFSTPAIACCMCKGTKKEDYEETVTLPCPDCKEKKN